MKVIKPSFEIVDDIDGEKVLKKLELAGRTCYKSEDGITVDSAKEFINKIIRSGHNSVIEHHSITVKIICDRGIMAEVTRHRICSFSVESSRYCNYGKDNEIKVIAPYEFEVGSIEYHEWYTACLQSEMSYLSLLGKGFSPQWARSVLPNSLKTEIIMTCNLREWRHFFRLRCHKTSHPQMREITIPMLKEFQRLIPIVFDDIN